MNEFNSDSDSDESVPVPGDATMGALPEPRSASDSVSSSEEGVSEQSSSEGHVQFAARSAAAGTSVSLVGSKIGGYLILSRLGRGGMADVYAARDLQLERDVAIKVLRADLAVDRDYIARFRREAKAAARLNHSNIVQIYEVGEDGAKHYIAQELVSGANLREYVDKHGPLSAEQAIEVLFGVASALDAAATEGITHRDIKPENLMWSKAGSVKVADFGLARLGNDTDGSRADLTQAGLTLGTPRYMSPEQVQGRPVDPRSDLYSLGVTMYHLLAGRPPFEADDPLALAFAHVNETPKPLDRARGDKDIPEWLVAIIAKLLRKDPRERFQSPAELLDALTGDDSDHRIKTSRLAGVATATARLQRVADEHQRRVVKRRLLIAVAVLAIAASAALGAATVSRAHRVSVAKLLRPEVVPEMESVEAQFVEAVIRDDAAGWRSVAEYFPPEENATYRAYATKSMLQLARYYIENGKLAEAESSLRALLDDPGVERRYRLVARAWQVRVDSKRDDPQKLNESKRQFNALYRELKSSNPELISWFDRIVPPREQVTLGLSLTVSE
jgi:serine/threonine-protein kinase